MRSSSLSLVTLLAVSAPALGTESPFEVVRARLEERFQLTTRGLRKHDVRLAREVEAMGPENLVASVPHAEAMRALASRVSERWAAAPDQELPILSDGDLKATAVAGGPDGTVTVDVRSGDGIFRRFAFDRTGVKVLVTEIAVTRGDEIQRFQVTDRDLSRGLVVGHEDRRLGVRRTFDRGRWTWTAVRHRPKSFWGRTVNYEPGLKRGSRAPSR